MHLAPKEVLHVYEVGNRRAEVQRVEEKYSPYRVVFQQRWREGENWSTLAPRYCSNLDSAIDSAKRFAFSR